MPTEISKIRAFEYLTFKLVEWFDESVTFSKENDISTLKALKLLFFVSSVNTVRDSQNTLLDTPSDKFVAMPYGHVESEIYDAIKSGQITNIEIDKSKTIINDSEAILELADDMKKRIDVAVQDLKKVNYSIINFTSFELVELSHQWFSWKKNYQKALENNVFMYQILANEIKSEDKFYHI